MPVKVQIPTALEQYVGRCDSVEVGTPKTRAVLALSGTEWPRLPPAARLIIPRSPVRFRAPPLDSLGSSASPRATTFDDSGLGSPEISLAGRLRR